MMLNEIKNTIFIPVQFMVPALRYEYYNFSKIKLLNIELSSNFFKSLTIDPLVFFNGFRFKSLKILNSS